MYMYKRMLLNSCIFTLFAFLTYSPSSEFRCFNPLFRIHSQVAQFRLQSNRNVLSLWSNSEKNCLNNKRTQLTNYNKSGYRKLNASGTQGFVYCLYENIGVSICFICTLPVMFMHLPPFTIHFNIILTFIVSKCNELAYKWQLQPIIIPPLLVCEPPLDLTWNHVTHCIHWDTHDLRFYQTSYQLE